MRLLPFEYAIRNLGRSPLRLLASVLGSVLVVLLVLAIDEIATTRQIDLPRVDEGMVNMNITGDPGMQLEEMDNAVDRIEDLLLADQHVETLFTTAGGFVFTPRISGPRAFPWPRPPCHLP